MLPEHIIRTVADMEIAGVEPAAVLAFIEVESNGKAFELDGKTPILRFERHLFHKYVPAAKRKAAVAAGLAIPAWSPKTQYADQRTSAERVALLHRAMQVDAEAALDSTSFGLPQICGFNAEACGYRNAADLYAHFQTGGVEEQVRALVAFLRSRGLVAPLAAGDWARVAKGYNGPAYRKNKYDTKMAAAFARYRARLRANPTAASFEALQLGSEGAKVRALQARLTALGFPCKADGDFGPGTKRAVGAAQVHYGRTGTGVAEPEFVDFLEDEAEPVEAGARALATMADLRKDSAIVKAADTAQGSTGVGILGKVAATVDLDAASAKLTEVQEKAELAHGIWDKVSAYKGALAPLGRFVAAHPGLVAVVVCGVVVIVAAHLIKRARLADHRSGKTV